MAKHVETTTCMHCGEIIPLNARACPHCGSDEKTGWSDETYLDGMSELDDVDYDELLQNEFPELAPKKKTALSWKVAVGAIVLICFIAGMLKILL